MGKNSEKWLIINYLVSVEDNVRVIVINLVLFPPTASNVYGDL